MIHARPQINGNTTTDFADAYVAISDARAAIEAAAKKVMADVFNGRNYQHLGNSDDAVIADRRRAQEVFRKALAALGELGSDVADAYDLAIGDAR